MCCQQIGKSTGSHICLPVYNHPLATALPTKNCQWFVDILLMSRQRRRADDFVHTCTRTASKKLYVTSDLHRTIKKMLWWRHRCVFCCTNCGNSAFKERKMLKCLGSILLLYSPACRSEKHQTMHLGNYAHFWTISKMMPACEAVYLGSAFTVLWQFRKWYQQMWSCTPVCYLICLLKAVACWSRQSPVHFAKQVYHNIYL